MVTERLTYFLESKCLFSSYQNGFSRGKNAMDALLCLQSEIRKAQTNMFNRLDLRGGGISGCRMSQALRICSGAFKSPVTAMQVEMGEMSFQSRRDKLTQECYEHSKSNLYSDLYIQKAITESPVVHLFSI